MNEIDADKADRNVLGLLLAEHPAPVHLAHLRRVVGRIDAEDGVGSLVRDGLAHVQGELVHASRAAVRAEQLAV